MTTGRELYSRYLSHEEMGQALHGLASLRPGWMKVEQLALSSGGRAVWVVTVTNPDTGTPECKPAQYVDGNIHAGEIAGSAVAMCLLHTLMTRADEPAIAQVLARTTFYVVPRIAVDGVEHMREGGPWVRSSPRPYPYEDEVKGLRQCDMDGDGEIRQMRVLDPAGGWMVSPTEPRLMVPRPLDAVEGPFYRVWSEGRVEGQDIRLHQEASSPSRIDFNRNFPANWRLEKDQAGAGHYPLCEPETSAMAHFITSHPNICGVQALHTGIEVVVPPEGVKAFRDFSPEDRGLFIRLGDRAQELTRFPFYSLMALGYADCPGDFSEWVFAHRGIPALVVELWSLPGRAGVTLPDHLSAQRDKPSTWHEVEIKCLRWSDDHLPADAFKPWTPFEHPQLGSLEIGGWKRGLWWSPPPGELLEELARRGMELILAQARSLPHIQVLEANSMKVGEGVFRVEILVENQGWLPTWLCRQGLAADVVEPGFVTAHLPEGVHLAQGEIRQKMPWLGGRGGRALLTWVVVGRAGASLTLHVDIPRGGQQNVVVVL